MKCKCGGELERIAVDCYQCKMCKLKQKVAFLEIPTPININSAIVIAPNSIKSNVEVIVKLLETQYKKIMR